MTQNLPARIDDLPVSLIDIAETLGMRVAVALLQNYGGMDIKFPIAPPPDHPIVKILGETDGHALCQFLGGGPMYVPHGRPARSQRREVMALHNSGMDNEAIARKLRITSRYVRMLVNDPNPPDGRQGSLFD